MWQPQGKLYIFTKLKIKVDVILIFKLPNQNLRKSWVKWAVSIQTVSLTITAQKLIFIIDQVFWVCRARNCTWHHDQSRQSQLSSISSAKRKLLTLLTALIMTNYRELRARSSIIELKKHNARHRGKEEFLAWQVVPSPEWLTQEKKKKKKTHTRLFSNHRWLWQQHLHLTCLFPITSFAQQSQAEWAENAEQLTIYSLKTQCLN